jgi:transcriptional regulator with XRE-family HTH domain
VPSRLAEVPRRSWDYAKLKSWRETAGLTREQVCADLQAAGHGITFNWLLALEHGTTGNRSPGLDTLVVLARYYGHEPLELLVAA